MGIVPGGKGSSGQSGIAPGGHLLTVPLPASSPPAMACLWSPAPAQLAGELLRTSSKQCRPGKGMSIPRKEAMKMSNSACLSVPRAGSSPFHVPGWPLPSLWWPMEPLQAISEGLGVPRRGGRGKAAQGQQQSCSNRSLPLLSLFLVPTERCHHSLPPKARLHPCHFCRWSGKSRPARGLHCQPQPFTAAPAAAR